MKRTRLIAFLLAISLTCALSAIVYAASGSYDSANDPIVTKSYVDAKFLDISAGVKQTIKDTIASELTAQLEELDIVGEIRDELKAELYDEIKDEILQDLKKEGVSADISFSLVSLTKGQTVVSKGCMELVLRSGTATAITVDDGLSDLTSGKDLASGEELSLDHYIINPIGDGRGVLVTSDTAYILVRGEYEIK